MVEAILKLLHEVGLGRRAHLQARLLDVDRLIDVGLDGAGVPGHVLDRGELHTPGRSRVRPLLLENAFRILEQGTLEEHEGEEVVHLLEDDDVLSPVAVAGLAPLDSLGQPAAEQDGPERRHLVRPLLRPSHVGIDVGIHRRLRSAFGA